MLHFVFLLHLSIKQHYAFYCMLGQHDPSIPTLPALQELSRPMHITSENKATAPTARLVPDSVFFRNIIIDRDV